MIIINPFYSDKRYFCTCIKKYNKYVFFYKSKPLFYSWMHIYTVESTIPAVVARSFVVGTNYHSSFHSLRRCTQLAVVEFGQHLSIHMFVLKLLIDVNVEQLMCK